MTPVLGLRAALILLVVIAIAPVFAVVVQASLAERQARLQRAEASLKALVDLGAAHQERMIDNARQVLTAVANAPPVYQDDAAACASYLRKLQAQYSEAFGTLGLLDAEGRLTCRATPPAQAVDSRDRRFFRAAVETGRFAVGEFTVSRADGRQVLTFGLPVYREGGKQLRGVAYLALDLEQASRQLRDLSITPETTLLVADADGIVLASAGPSAPAAGSALASGFLRDAVLAGRPRFERSADSQGKEWLFALQPVGRAGENKVFVAGSTSSDAILAPTTRRLQMQLGALALITLLAAGLAWAFAGRVLLKPMRRLLGQVETLAQEGERLDRPPPPAVVREFGELHRRFHAMAQRLAERAVQRDGAMAEMEHQNNLLESVLESMAEGVLVVDRQGRFAHINGAAQRILPGLPAITHARGAAMASSQEWGIYELDGVTPCPPQQRPFTLALQGRPVEQYRYLVRGPLSAGREIIIQGSARPIMVPGQPPTGAVVVFSDITHAWRAEQSLKDSEQRYRSLFESNPHPMWVYDVETLRFLNVNDAAVAHYGYSRGEFLAMTIADIRPQQEVPALMRAVQTMQQPIGKATVWRHRLKDGRLIDVEVTSHSLQYEGRPARMVMAHDVTERLLAQDALQQLNETLERRVDARTRELALANEELESFSYSVSHDLRAPLQVIDGFGRALTTRHGERLDGQARHYVDRIRDNTRQMGQLIDDLLALARVTRTELHTERFDLSAQAHRAVDQLRQRFPDREVLVDIERPLPCVGDSRLMGVVMENLIGNAWKFTSRVQVARIEVGRHTGGAEGDVYFVSDNGAGFDMAFADKLFKAFQRLHAANEFEGTGIGLATVHRIITRHGGRVWAESQPGRGATFLFTLKRGPAP